MYRLSQDAQESMQRVNQRVAQIINKSIQSEAVQNQIQQLNKMPEECLSRYSNRQLQVRTIMDDKLAHDQAMSVISGNIERAAQSANQRMWNQMNIQRLMANQNQQLTHTTNRLIAVALQTSQSAIEAIQLSVQSAFERQVESSRRIIDQFEGMASQQIAVALESSQSLIKSTQLSVQSVIDKQIESSRKLVEQFEAIVSQRIDAEGHALINSYNWLLVPGLPEEFEIGLYTLLENKPSQEELDRFYCQWFREKDFEQLSNLIDNWDSPFFVDRNQAIQQVFEAHKMGWYDLTVHRMLSMIDAISFGFANTISPKHQSLSAWGAFQRLEERYIGQKLDHILLRLTSYLIQEYVFVDTRKTSRRPILNRHSILHEEDLNYGTEANSIRCFLLLQTLHYFISQPNWVVN